MSPEAHGWGVLDDEVGGGGKSGWRLERTRPPGQ